MNKTNADVHARMFSDYYQWASVTFLKKTLGFMFYKKVNFIHFPWVFN